jgi:hypothetical protein
MWEEWIWQMKNDLCCESRKRKLHKLCPVRRMLSSGTSQKTTFFIVTAVKASNRTFWPVSLGSKGKGQNIQSNLFPSKLSPLIIQVITAVASFHDRLNSTFAK